MSTRFPGVDTTRRVLIGAGAPSSPGRNRNTVSLSARHPPLRTVVASPAAALPLTAEGFSTEPAPALTILAPSERTEGNSCR